MSAVSTNEVALHATVLNIDHHNTKSFPSIFKNASFMSSCITVYVLLAIALLLVGIL